jgi:hypothetical protein
MPPLLTLAVPYIAIASPPLAEPARGVMNALPPMEEADTPQSEPAEVEQIDKIGVGAEPGVELDRVGQQHHLSNVVAHRLRLGAPREKCHQMLICLRLAGA